MNAVEGKAKYCEKGQKEKARGDPTTTKRIDAAVRGMTFKK